MITEKDIFESRLAGKPLDVGRLPLLKGPRTKWILNLLEMRVIRLISIDANSKSIDFEALIAMKVFQPLKQLHKWVGTSWEIVVPAGEEFYVGRLKLRPIIELDAEQRKEESK